VCKIPAIKSPGINIPVNISPSDISDTAAKIISTAEGD
tara:strand:- start:1581 stop:1694 length:114 start_codon:yes stop_codon:yes gene_type:complete